MSLSSFHQHFKAMSAKSPLQYQMQLRLQEARWLMLSGHIDAADAGFRVGYDSPSQFSREYSRTFGAPPMRDMSRLRANPGYAHGDLRLVTRQAAVMRTQFLPPRFARNIAASAPAIN